jgi:transcriptional regulator with XRE-family HTH domain
MKEVRRRARIAMLQRGLTFLDLERLSGMKRGTIQNILSGFSSSTRARRAITNALGTQIFDDTIPTEARHTFLKDTTVEFVDSPEFAVQFGNECKAKVRVRGCTVTFLEDTTFFL